MILDHQIHANDVRECMACHQRVTWLKNHRGWTKLVNVPDTERGKSWLCVDDQDIHICPRKELLDMMKVKTKRA